ncbi:hypothetical protein PG985_014377 [Apiospora marii]|uniref:uncharacterized protein n=1 Tax=Apiospora marii TaxID=335849 RepID=UPI00312E5EF6
MANKTKIELHQKGMPDGYTVSENADQYTGYFVGAGIVGFVYFLCVCVFAAAVYKAIRETYPVFRNDGCLVVFLPVLSFVAGVIFPVWLSAYLAYLCVTYVVRKACAEGGTCCGINFASFKARRAARRAQRLEEQMRFQQQQQQRQHRVQQPDQTEPYATPPPAYTAQASPSDMEAELGMSTYLTDYYVLNPSERV